FQDLKKLYNTIMDQITLRQSIQQVQRVGKSYGFSVAIVGGAMVRLILKHTKIQKIDTKNKVIYLSDAAMPKVSREEDAKTLIDIDAIVFSDSKDPFEGQIKQQFEELKLSLYQLQTSQKGFPPIS